MMVRDFGGSVGVYRERYFNYICNKTKQNIPELNLNFWYDLYQNKQIAFYFYKLHKNFRHYLIPEYMHKSINVNNKHRLLEIKNLILSNKYFKISELPGHCINSVKPEFWIFRGWSEEEALEKISEIQRKNCLKFHKKRKENPELYIGYNDTSIEYYLKKGLSEEDAKAALKERQATFTLEKCIKRHGLEEGTRIFNERQDKWQNTLNSKTQEEKDAINRSKGSGISNYKDKNSPGKLYYIRFFNDEIEFWKIGITVRDLVNRWNLDSIGITKNLKYEILFINNYDNINDAYIQEQYILNAFDSERVIIDYNGFKTTEAFNKDVLIEYYKKDKIK